MLRLRDRTLVAPAGEPLIMGIVNASPESFSDGGLYDGLDAQVARAEELTAAGAAIIDVGGESGVTGVDPLVADEEIRRVAPLVARLVGLGHGRVGRHVEAVGGPRRARRGRPSHQRRERPARHRSGGRVRRERGRDRADAHPGRAEAQGVPPLRRRRRRRRRRSCASAWRWRSTSASTPTASCSTRARLRQDPGADDRGAEPSRRRRRPRPAGPAGGLAQGLRRRADAATAT